MALSKSKKSAAQKRAANDRRVARNVARYGCHVISVFDPDDKLPTFSYSVVQLIYPTTSGV